MKRMIAVLLLIMACLAVNTMASAQQKRTGTAAPAPRQLPASFADPATGMQFVLVKGGCFQMGDGFGDGDVDEKPIHEACVNDLYLGKFEVKVGEFRTFVDETGYVSDAEKGSGCFTFAAAEWKLDESANWRRPGFTQTADHPAVCISWNDASIFAAWLSSKTGKGYRLPTEAEWEYAARSGGKSYKYSWGNGAPSGNIADESLKRAISNWQWSVWNGYDDGHVFTAPGGAFKPNDLGLYDMTGNVWEWCADWYGDNYYAESPRKDPQGAVSGKYRVLRGGSWGNTSAAVRTSYRLKHVPTGRFPSDGFRLAVPAQ